MFCTKCGQCLPDDANFCSKCGNKVARDEQSNHSNVRLLRLRCSGCGGTMTSDPDRPLLKCPHCGAFDLIVESDDVTIQRVKSKAYRDVQLEKQKNDKEIEIARLKTELEKSKHEYNKSKDKEKTSIWGALISIIGFLLMMYMMSSFVFGR